MNIKFNNKFTQSTGVEDRKEKHKFDRNNSAAHKIFSYEMRNFHHIIEALF